MPFMPSAAFVFAASLATARGGPLNGVWFDRRRATGPGVVPGAFKTRLGMGLRLELRSC
ncbi:hypothetical protein [Corallococcus sp. EGB]|uniref:hypothetical protein n=1 Tax=Corallococcus sp. EGB TaxID=1521117 RepID=UPI001CBD37C1|nr:hypothetical protein [Corallococcus sp. EGB]